MSFLEKLMFFLEKLMEGLIFLWKALPVTTLDKSIIADWRLLYIIVFFNYKSTMLSKQ